MASKLRDAASSVLEMMFAAPVLADQEFPPADVTGPILVALEFVGQVKGTFALAAGAEPARQLALGFMGMNTSEHLDRQQVIEVLGELANMLCGHFLGQLNYHESFQLSTPKEVTLESLTHEGHSYQRTVHLESGALSMQVAIHA
ncbi:MAG TPA: chemotaxis protein CheX [Bryobacteraceae bacterium]